MKLVRHYKEEIIQINSELPNIKDEQKKQQMQDMIKKMKSTIELFSKYGSHDW